ncbi:MAG: glycosyltransferase involved in cell wall biosynthesis [Cellvibrionaceae bacterium]|jgi:glycosyltransferase involved in cell wall biosynthesis
MIFPNLRVREVFVSTLAVLIPEFPGQTHAFFMREKAAMESMGARVHILSTRRPVAKESEAKHAWASEAASKTTYLTPLGLGQWLLSIAELVRAGPLAWWRCLVCALTADIGFKDKITMLGLVLLGAFLKRHTRVNAISHIHVHSCANAANITLFNRLLGGVPYSMTLHGPLQDYGFNQKAKWKHAAFVVVITNDLMAESKKALSGIQLPPLCLAPMGVNVDHFKRAGPYLPPAKGQMVKLVSCGRIHPVKAHDDLIRAVALLKEKGVIAQLVICGAPDSQSYTRNYSQELDKLADELKVSDQIFRLGSISEERVKQALEEAHIFCLASLKEPLGVATMEAMSMAIPVVVARSPGVKEMINGGEDGFLVEPRAPEEFAEAIQLLIEQPEKAELIALAGRKKVVEKYHSGVSAKVILDAITCSGC